MALRISDEENKKLNPGQVDYENTFNALNESETDGTFEDDSLDDYDEDDDYDNYDEDEVYDDNGEKVDYTKNKNSKDINNAEKNQPEPDNKYTKKREELEKKLNKQKNRGNAYKRLAKWTGPLKKKGPLVSMILTVVGGGLIIGATMSPSLLIVHVKEIFTNRFFTAKPALMIRSNRNMYQKFKGIKNAFSESSTGKCNIKCKFGTMSDTMVRNLKANGYKVELDESMGKSGLFGTRSSIKSITPPYSYDSNGNKYLVAPTIKTGADWAKYHKDPLNAKVFADSFNSRTAYFLNSKFGNMLYHKFGIDKLSKIKSSVTDEINNKVLSVKESVKRSLRLALGLPAVATPKAPLVDIEALKASNPTFAKVHEFVTNGPVKKFSVKATTVINGFCAVYNTSKGITYAIKAAKIAAFVGLAMVFINLADQIKAGDSPDPEVTEPLGNQLTALDENGKSATDSLSYRNAAYGDTGPVSAEDIKYSPTTSSGVLVIIGELMALVGVGTAISLSVVSKLCQATGNIATDVATTCPGEITTAILSLAGGVTAPGAVGALGACFARYLITVLSIQVGMKIILGKIIPAVAEHETPTIDENTVGTPLGTAYGNGVAQLAGGMSADYGLEAADKAGIEQYAIDTAQIRKQDADLAYLEASKTPFDAYNPNSFLGLIIQKTGMLSLYNSSIFSSLGNILSVVPKSFASLNSLTGAVTIDIENTYTCTDQGLLSIGVNGDSYCNPTYVMSTDELEADINTTIDYMVSNNYINEDTGEPIIETKMAPDPSNFLLPVTLKTDYQKYLTYCSGRTEPLGETGIPLENLEYEWAVGLKCTEKSEQLKNFRVYTMDKSINDTMDGDESLSSQGDSTIIDIATPVTETVLTNDDTGTTMPGYEALYSDSTKIACAKGTIDAGNAIGYHDSTQVNIKLCTLPNTANVSNSMKPIQVNSIISGVWYNIIESIKEEIRTNTLKVKDGFRSWERQEELYQRFLDGKIKNSVAAPGTSSHQMGFAIDFIVDSSYNNAGPYTGQAIYDFLKENESSANFNICRIENERWHWKPRALGGCV